MIKNLIWIFLILFLFACSTQDEQYYRTHPKALQQALLDCPNSRSSQVSCEQLKAISLEIKQLIYKLEENPQAFGKKILTLQTELTQLQAQSSKEVTPKINALKQQLAEYLAVVRWLESPVER